MGTGSQPLAPGQIGPPAGKETEDKGTPQKIGHDAGASKTKRGKIRRMTPPDARHVPVLDQTPIKIRERFGGRRIKAV